MNLVRVWFALILLVWGGNASAATLAQVLAQPVPPPGVVFEVVDRDPRALEVALPWVKQASAQLRRRFPGLPMALVTHGQEMFALQSSARQQQAAVHQLAERLARDDHIPVHVCETYASRRGLAAEDFPDYIDVAPEGPAQIRDYEALDYVRIVVPRASPQLPSRRRRPAAARARAVGEGRMWWAVRPDAPRGAAIQKGTALSNATISPVAGWRNRNAQACSSSRLDRARCSSGA